MADGRGLAVSDFDRDGAIDLIVTNAGGRPILYRNQIEGRGDWIQLHLSGEAPNVDAVGAQVRIWSGGEEYLRFVDGGNGFAGQSSKIVHLGLGRNGKVDDIEVRWPNGRRQRYGSLAPGKRHILKQSGGNAPE